MCDSCSEGNENDMNWTIKGLSILYMNGSNMECGVKAGVYSAEIGVALSLRLESNAIILQAKLLLVFEACKIFRAKHQNKATI